MDNDELKCAAEAVLFAAGEPLKLTSIARALEISEGRALTVLQELKDDYDKARRGIRIVQMENEYQMLSRGDYFPQVRRVIRNAQVPLLSQAALETLAIVAYRQPVARADVEYIRGVSSSSSLDLLVERGLVAPSGRMNLPGRPMGYKTTGEFLKMMGISSLSELPDMKTFSEGIQMRLSEDTEIQ